MHKMIQININRHTKEQQSTQMASSSDTGSGAGGAGEEERALTAKMRVLAPPRELDWVYCCVFCGYIGCTVVVDVYLGCGCVSRKSPPQPALF